MSEIGNLINQLIEKNRDGDQLVRMLKLQITDPDDVQSVEYMQGPGEDSNPPLDSQVLTLSLGEAWQLAIALNDGVEPDPSLLKGEKKVYASDSGVIKSFITLLKSGVIKINGDADFAVRYNALNTALQAFITDLNAKLFTAFATVPYSWPGTSVDISGSKVDKVKLP